MQNKIIEVVFNTTDGTFTGYFFNIAEITQYCMQCNTEGDEVHIKAWRTMSFNEWAQNTEQTYSEKLEFLFLWVNGGSPAWAKGWKRIKVEQWLKKNHNDLVEALA